MTDLFKRFPLPKPGSQGKINRAPSPIVATAMPWATIVLGSLVPVFPLIASAPLLPPFSFMMLLAWSQVRPGLLPLWAGLPLGLVDDIYSGQPFGSGILLWSATIMASDLIEAHYPWRNFATEWLIAAGFIVAYLLISLAIANAAGGSVTPEAIVPQLLLSLLLYPLTGRMVAWCDRIRLMPFVEMR